MSEIENQEMMMSPTLGELAKALSKAQAAMNPALKDTTNPFFKSKYADLASIWQAAQKPLTDQGLCVVQQIGNDGENITMTTMLLHSSGEWIRSIVKAMPGKKDPQSLGSTATYLRRYGLSALVGISTEDDDGNAGSRADEYSSKIFPTPKTQGEPTRFQKELSAIHRDEETRSLLTSVADTILGKFSPFYNNKDAAASYVKEKTGKMLRELNAVELEQLQVDFLKEYFPPSNVVEEQKEMF